MRVFIVFFIFVSAVIAIFKDAHPEVTFIAQMMGVSWGALAGSFLAPFLYGLYWKGVTKASAFVCFIWGCAVAVIQLVITLGGVDVSLLGTGTWIHFQIFNQFRCDRYGWWTYSCSGCKSLYKETGEESNR